MTLHTWSWISQGAWLKRFLATLVCAGFFLNPLSAMPASASSCLSKADQAAKSRSNFDFLYMETCYKSLGFSSTQPACASLINTASGLYNIDWAKEAFRKVVEYDSCRETLAAKPNPQPEPKPSSSSSKPVAPLVPVTPEKQKELKCKAKPQSSLAKLVYLTPDSLDDGIGYYNFNMGRWSSAGVRHWVGTDGYLGIRFHIKTSTSALTWYRYQVKTSVSKGKWSSWRNLPGAAGFGPIYPGMNYFTAEPLDVSLGSTVKPNDVEKVRVRVQLGNDCGYTAWQELTNSSGLSLFDPKRGNPSTLSCTLVYSDSSSRTEEAVNIYGFGDECGDYQLNDPNP